MIDPAESSPCISEFVSKSPKTTEKSLVILKVLKSPGVLGSGGAEMYKLACLDQDAASLIILPISPIYLDREGEDISVREDM